MTIRRAKRKKDDYYVRIDNRTARDKRLSWEAKGLLTYILSMDDDWTVMVKELVKASPNAKERKIRVILKELEDLGYIVPLGQLQKSDGKWTKFDRIINEVSTFNKKTALLFTASGDTAHGPTASGQAQRISTTEEEVLLNISTTKNKTSAEKSAEPPKIYSSLEEAQRWSEAQRLCELLADLIEENGNKKPTVTKEWVQAMEKTIRIDQRTPTQLENAIRWVQQHDFWSQNILSPTKLRAQYDRIRMQAVSEKKIQAPKSFSAIEQFLNED